MGLATRDSFNTRIERIEHPETGLVPFFFDDFTSGVLDDTKWWKSGRPYKIDGADYVDASSADDCRYLDENVSVVDGQLRIAMREHVTTRAGVTKNYSTGMVTTAGPLASAPGSFRQRFSPPVRLDISAMIPAGRALWPALWLMPVRDGWPPEIDIIETHGQTPGTAHTTFHYDPGSGPASVGRASTRFGDLSDGFHVYSVEWRTTTIRYFVDYVLAFEVDNAYVPSEEMYLIVSCLVGSETTWPGPPDDTTPFPSYFVVDWVKASTISA